MSNIFEIINYEGCKISCSSQQWFGHIVNSHEIMKNNVEAVKDTIKKPDYVYESSDTLNNRDVYFKKSSAQTYNRSFYTKVIIDNNNHEVITAFPSRNVKGGIGNAKYPV